ncbi:unnamed protein product [Pleuronectes platessa]|uniref:Uncharacterized protein n=1 Tax=Pleuronectes platessa TaxID=8262 RepID=A0A9N7YNQ0_PLEPL|nr:unnamed protein product [Pleuronectes platessa]
MDEAKQGGIEIERPERDIRKVQVGKKKEVKKEVIGITEKGMKSKSNMRWMCEGSKWGVDDKEETQGERSKTQKPAPDFWPCLAAFTALSLSDPLSQSQTPNLSSQATTNNMQRCNKLLLKWFPRLLLCVWILI